MVERIIRRWASVVSKNSFSIIIFIFFLAIVLSFFLPKIKINHSVDVFFDKKSESYIEFEKWKEQFGSNQIIIVAFQDKDIFTQKNLELISALTEKFEALPYVEEVTSLTNVNDIVGEENNFIVKPLIEKIPAQPAQLKQLKKQALSNPLYLKNIISSDGKTTAILIELEREAGEKQKKEVMEEVIKIVKKNPEKKFYISGFTAIEYFYTLYMQNDLKRFLPFIFVIIILILVLTFRRWEGVVLPLLVIIVSFIFTMSFLYFCGFSINNVTTIIPPIILAIAVADSVHFVAEGMNMRRKDMFRKNKEFVFFLVSHLFLPCFLTSLTTAVGFLSLTVSRIPPVKELGLVVGVGVFFAFFITFTLLPALTEKFGLLRREYPEREKYSFFQERFDRFLEKIGKFAVEYKRIVIIITAGIALLCLWGMLRIKVETSVLEYFKKNTPIYQDTSFIEENLSGVHFLNISLKARKEDYFKEPEVLFQIERLQRFLKSLPQIDKVTSCIDYIKEINKSFHNEDPKFYKVPSSKKLIAQYLLLYGAQDLEDFVDSQWRWTTIRVRVKEHSTAKLKRIISCIQKYLDSNLNIEAEKKIVGQTVLEVETNEAVTQGQIQSLAIAMFIIFGMMFFVFKSIPVGLISIVPNVLPILINFGIMGWLGIRLDSATSMISAIGVGIIVDDTIHFLHHFGVASGETKDYSSAVFKTLLAKGRPIILTSLILFFGFGVVSLSNFVPTSYFGILSSLLMFNALWADLVVLPSLLVHFKPRFR